MLKQEHQSFLGKYALQDEHYSKTDAPFAHLGNPDLDVKSLVSEWNKYATGNDEMPRKMILGHKNATAKLIHHVLKHFMHRLTPETVIAAVSNKNTNAESLGIALKHSNISVQQKAAGHRNMTDDMLFDVLQFHDVPVRKIAAANKNTSKNTLSYALEDSNVDVIKAAINNPRYKEYSNAGK